MDSCEHAYLYYAPQWGGVDVAVVTEPAPQNFVNCYGGIQGGSSISARGFNWAAGFNTVDGQVAPPVECKSCNVPYWQSLPLDI